MYNQLKLYSNVACFFENIQKYRSKLKIQLKRQTFLKIEARIDIYAVELDFLHFKNASKIQSSISITQAKS